MIAIAVVLSACGGGNSSSGGPPPVALKSFQVGAYTGTLTLGFTGAGLVGGEPTEGPFSLDVSGVAGNQQVRIAFREFSGTSFIGQDGQFRIPSGPFRLPIGDRSGRDQIICNGEMVFEGMFNDVDNSVSGTTDGQFTCPNNIVGPITLDGSFRATFGSAKIFGQPSLSERIFTQ